MQSKYLIVMICLIFVSCKTYTIEPLSFKEQLLKVDPESMKSDENSKVRVGLTNVKFSYKSNKISYIKVVDKKGEKDIIANSPAIEMRVTLKNNKKYHFYFDTVYLQNDTLIGGKSRFMPNLVTKIPFDEIFKIEVQDGGKNMKYSN